MQIRVDIALKVLALVTALAPITGSLVRLVSFRASGVVPASLAWQLPLPDLAAVGVVYGLGVLLSLLLLFFVARTAAPALFVLKDASNRMAAVDIGQHSKHIEVLVDRAQRRLATLRAVKRRNAAANDDPTILNELHDQLQQLETESDRDEALYDEVSKESAAIGETIRSIRTDVETVLSSLPRWIRPLRWSGWLALPTFFLVLLLPAQTLPSYASALLGAAWFVLLARRTGRLDFSDIALPIVPIVLITSALWGLYPSYPSTGTYTFVNPTPQLRKGLYASVGSSDHFQYLIACQGDQLLAVPPSQIQSIVIPAPRGPDTSTPNIFQLLSEKQTLHFGLQPPAC